MLVAIAGAFLGAVAASSVRAEVDPDSLYLARHPSLLYGPADVPALRARVQAPGAPAAAYAFILDVVQTVYPTAPFDTLLHNDFAQEPIVNLGLAAYLNDPVDPTALALGRDLTLHIARTFDVDDEAYGSALRLRSLAIGYDAYFGVATPIERAEIRAEAASYIAYITANMNYDVWLHRPYVSNKSAMLAAALGLAAISFADEIDPALIASAFARSDALYAAWRDAHLSDDACYREGSLYGLWSLRQLVYYFHARKRFDGTVYSGDWALRWMERWLAYELDPRGGARMNNIQDQTDYFLPLARHTTYFDWAMSEWGSGLSRYLWDRASGPLGVDMGDENDKAGTVLWHQDVASVNPGTLLPRSMLWESRGLYYYRSGWTDQAASDDISISFYCGEFRGGHAQEDQTQFTLTAFGEKLVIDHGSGSMARQSEAHNIVRIDQAGQHNAGSSIGTDGRIAESMLTDFADYVCGDATAAYTTYSPYNAAGVPYPWTDWSWGYTGANPVEHALRRVLVVHDSDFPTYLIVQDDIDKDGEVHRYDWCVHFPEVATVDTSIPAGPIGVAVGNARLDVHAIFPLKPKLPGVTLFWFDNQSEDPDSRMLALTSFAVNPKFAVLLMPRRDTDPAPLVFSSTFSAGTMSVVRAPSGAIDVVFARGNRVGPIAPMPLAELPDAEGCGSISIDAELAVVRLGSEGVSRYLAVDARSIACAAGDIFTLYDGPATIAFDGTRVHIDRPDATFRILADGVSEVVCRGEVVPTGLDGRYLVRVSATDVPAPPARDGLALRAFPNPFNPSARISFATPARGRVDAAVYDAAGRFVARLASGVFPAGEHDLSWDGRDHAGRAAASGVYFLRVRAGTARETLKLVLLR
ncbi:MAG TPA: FlgD immunoglobulin-like domain containing protein [Candidatus Krumholzibacteria bacterium]|nr:FlgD immunoglobulin-like domain containing protein [Candidatus Krumholzibacteria bacterium]